MKKLMKRGVALVLAVMMCVGMLTVSASAAVGEYDNQKHEFYTQVWFFHNRHVSSGAFTVTPATCKTAEIHTYRCDVDEPGNEPCGAEHSVEAGLPDPSAHAWGAWQSIGDEEHQRICKYDSAHTEAVGHNKATTYTDWVDCTDSEHAGQQERTKTEACAVCGWSKTTTEYQSKEPEPTETSKPVETPKPTETSEPTTPCTHEETTRTVTSEPTCMQKGNAEITCDICHSVVSNEEINPLEHDYTGAVWQDADPNSNTADGKHVMICTREGCDGADHGRKEAVHGGYIEVNKVTDEFGITTTTYKCGDCTHTYTVETWPCNHRNDDGTEAFENVAEKPGNCTESGSVTWECTKCKEVRTEDTGIIANAHKYPTTWDKANADAAQHWKVCGNNSAHVLREDHSWSGWTWEDYSGNGHGLTPTATQKVQKGVDVCADCGYERVDYRLVDKGLKTFTVIYVDDQSGMLGKVVSIDLYEGDPSVAVEKKAFDGFEFDHMDRETISYNDGTQTVYVYYKAIEYTVFWNNWNGTTLESRKFTMHTGVPAASTYTGATPTRPGTATTYFVFNGWSAGVRSEKTGAVTYTAQFVERAIGPVSTQSPAPTPSQTPTPTPSEVIIDEPDTPLVDEPDLPEVEIDEPDTPLTELPEIEIDDPEVPLANVPQTGDMSVLWYAAAALPVCGLAMTFLPKKEEDAEE